MLDTYDCKHTLRINNIYCISTATMVEKTRLSVTLYLNFLSCQFAIIFHHIIIKLEGEPLVKYCQQPILLLFNELCLCNVINKSMMGLYRLVSTPKFCLT
jgi:hypothetical protein